jgi:hypothetical protein
MGKDFDRVVKPLQDLQEERDDFKLKMENIYVSSSDNSSP